MLLAITARGNRARRPRRRSSSPSRSSRRSTSRAATRTSPGTGSGSSFSSRSALRGTMVGWSSSPRRRRTRTAPRPPRPTARRPARSRPRTTETAPARARGDAAAGEAVFASAGCGGCHTLEAAGSSGNVGPNLDEAKPDVALVVDRVTNGMGVMPSFEGSSARSRSRTSLRTSSRPRSASHRGYPVPARRGVRAAEGARLEIAYASKGVSRVQIPPSPLPLFSKSRFKMPGRERAGFLNSESRESADPVRVSRVTWASRSGS